MAELIDKKLVLKDIATWAVGGNPEEPEMVRMDELAMAMGVSVGRLPTTTEAEIRAMAIDEFAEKMKAEIMEEIYDISERQRLYEVNSEMSTTCSHIMGTLRDVHNRMIDKIAEQLKEE